MIQKSNPEEQKEIISPLIAESIGNGSQVILKKKKKKGGFISI